MIAEQLQQPPEDLTLQENALAAAMLHRMGDATIRYAMRDGDRVHDVPRLGEEDIDDLAVEFAKDPKESLAWARESLFAIGRDPQASDARKSERLDRYLDAYASLTVRLDNKAFPPTPAGEVRKGVPEYLPDGLVDMGNDPELNSQRRERDMIKVDKEAILRNYKPVLKEMFSADFGEAGSSTQKQSMLRYLAAKVYTQMPYNDADKSRTGTANLSEMSEGVCRHKAMVFQTLAQAAGLKTTLMKAYVKVDEKIPEKHVANLARINGQWYIIDPTMPDYVPRDDGQNEWRLGVMKASAPPVGNELKRYEGVMKNSGEKRTYTAGTNMHWRIEP